MLFVSAVENPFERYDLDPNDGVEAITERMRELVLEADDDEARERIRAVWEELTMHPARRFRAALLAHPETRAPLGTPPLPTRQRAVDTSVELHDLLARPSVLETLRAHVKEPVLFEAASVFEDPLMRRGES